MHKKFVKAYFCALIFTVFQKEPPLEKVSFAYAFHKWQGVFYTCRLMAHFYLLPVCTDELNRVELKNGNTGEAWLKLVQALLMEKCEWK